MPGSPAFHPAADVNGLLHRAGRVDPTAPVEVTVVRDTGTSWSAVSASTVGQTSAGRRPPANGHGQGLVTPELL